MGRAVREERWPDPESVARRAAQWIADHAKARNDIDVEIVDLADYKLPLFDAAASDAWMPTPNPEAAR
ncbi:MAG: NAD(P)H-dependent oxidoreductase, partial [Deltaproteobacteria bacterium]|nr:NAD(P)H-dependent oxidoreductase [Kofleriaceae bacterium]